MLHELWESAWKILKMLNSVIWRNANIVAKLILSKNVSLTLKSRIIYYIELTRNEGEGLTDAVWLRALSTAVLSQDLGLFLNTHMAVSNYL